MFNLEVLRFSIEGFFANCCCCCCGCGDGGSCETSSFSSSLSWTSAPSGLCGCGYECIRWRYWYGRLLLWLLSELLRLVKDFRDPVGDPTAGCT